MKKGTVRVLAAVMGVMMLAGCGNHNTNAVEKSQADTEEDRELSLIHI